MGHEVPEALHALTARLDLKSALHGTPGHMPSESSRCSQRRQRWSRDGQKGSPHPDTSEDSHQQL